uniref:Uncharacterized protein n=1 Tax=Pithovirus LCPAC403 TaxID=2506596 RepID=A0A481ZBA9_9VIRU|nr:MAG: hypothetical protein LCPAC403_03470 [Pithovirus LCPAC403]
MSEGDTCKILIAVVIVVFVPIIFIPISSIQFIGYNYVSNLPQGDCSFNETARINADVRDWGSVEIPNVPVFDIYGDFVAYFTIKYPPPPTKVNLQRKRSITDWISSTTSSRNGLRCHYDVETNEAWTDPINLTTAVALMTVGLICVLFWMCICFITKEDWLPKFKKKPTNRVEAVVIEI